MSKNTGETTLLESTSLDDSFAAIGDVLRAARIDRGIGIGDIAQELRISRAYIRSLETGDFDQLPGPTYVTGYLRSYGGMLGVDGQSLIERYQALLGPGQNAPEYNFPINNQKPQRSGAVLASVAVIVGVMGYAGWYWAGKPGFEGASPVDSVDNIVSQSVAPSVAVNETLSGNALLDIVDDDLERSNTAEDIAPAIVAQPATQDETGTVAETTAAVQAPADAPDAPAATAALQTPSSPEIPVDTVNTAASKVGAVDDNGGDAEKDVPALAPTEREPDRSSAIATSREPEVEIILRATASSWVEIVRNDGEEVMTRLMRDGDTYLLDGGENLYLSTGNAGGLEFVFPNGSVLSAGDVGEILRDLPLKSEDLLANL